MKSAASSRDSIFTSSNGGAAVRRLLDARFEAAGWIRLAVFLTDRVEGITQVRRYLTQMRADDLPLLVIAIEHDGPGSALPKQPKKPAGIPYPKTPE